MDYSCKTGFPKWRIESFQNITSSFLLPPSSRSKLDMRSRLWNIIHTKNKNNDGGTVTVHCTVYIEKRRTSGPMTPRTKQLDGLSLFHPYTFSASNKYVLEICKTIQIKQRQPADKTNISGTGPKVSNVTRQVTSFVI